MPSATLESNRDLCRRFVDEVFNGHDVTALDRVVAPSFVDHGLPPDLPPDRQGTRTFLNRLFLAFPDTVMRVLAEYCVGDAVIFRWRCTGTHRGEFMGAQASNRRVQVDGIHIFRCANGKIAEVWAQWDALGLQHQLRGPGADSS